MSEIGWADMVHCVSLFMDAQCFVSCFHPKYLEIKVTGEAFQGSKKLLQPVVVCLSTVVQRSAQITQISLLI